MRKQQFFLAMLIVSLFYACTGTGYNTQKGAVIGAGVGALAGQSIGHDTESTLIGTAVGALAGTIAGNAVDQYDDRQRVYGLPYHSQPIGGGSGGSGGCH